MNLAFIHSWGFLVLAIWLIIEGLMRTFGIGNPVVHTLLSIAMVIAGVLILLGK